MPPVRVELTTSRLLGGRGNQLRQGGRVINWAGKNLNNYIIDLGRNLFDAVAHYRAIKNGIIFIL